MPSTGQQCFRISHRQNLLDSANAAENGCANLRTVSSLAVLGSSQSLGAALRNIRFRPTQLIDFRGYLAAAKVHLRTNRQSQERICDPASLGYEKMAARVNWNY